ncbi:RagB/SusD family nutrient uptake outer membrane protein [Chitinophaga filiformis]|uniref:RagB/SusD family nutrient uptake outer membrane protein n=1 Tax=Chitinophaga filiformis TaxID=104663 RepID=A0ABY4I080_CHIFI|nr:RagB/SusD family nutrient uptake outer membrane protein [Chitinophaga filiformis]UPK68799.1 RagB/SusD family nutrient uptake outer membrane protein [Chitinophaga filiformis]
MINRILFTSAIILLSACTEKLDIKPDQSMVIPQTVADFQAMIDYTDILNAYIPSYGEAGADNYYITDATYNGLVLNSDRNAYIWGKDIFPVKDIAVDWANGYVRINYCNLVLEGLEKLTTGKGTAAYNNVKGAALFFRALSFYTLAEEFSKPYDSATAATDPGIPLRLKSEMEVIYQRASVKATYEQVLSDLAVAAELLPDITTFKTRPSKAVIYGLLARIYLSLGNYQEALKNADLSLSIYHELLDYNTIDPDAGLPFDEFNDDVLFYAKLSGNGLTRMATMIVDSLLYRQYQDNDLRKVLFFRDGAGGIKMFKGTYSGNSFQHFGGIGVDEMYISRAECYARMGDVAHAMEDLNTLLRTRWKTGTYADMTASDPDDALRKILVERRKELLFRGLRWLDLRRLNKDTRFAKTLKRIVNGSVYELPPNDVRYVYPIPADEISYSGIEQNVR